MAGKDDPMGDRARIRALDPASQADFLSRPPLARAPSYAPIGARSVDYGPDPLGRPQADTSDLGRYPQLVGPLHPDGPFRRNGQAAPEQPINFYPDYSLKRLVDDADALYRPLLGNSSSSEPSYPPPNAPMAIGRWVNRVWPKGDWDFKTKPDGYPRYEGFGNYAYGATGAAIGLPDSVLLRGAGLAQQVFNMKKNADGKTGYDRAWGNFLSGPPYGDDPLDQISIKKGITDARAYRSQQTH